MFRRFSTNFAVLSIFLDAALIDLALFVSTVLRSPLNRLHFLQKIPPVHLPPILYIIFPVMWVGVLLVFSVYDGRKNLKIVDEFTTLVLGSCLSSISLAGVLYFTYRDVSRFLFLMACGSALLLMILWRIAARLIFRKQGLHAQARQVLILGAGIVGQKVKQQINLKPSLGLHIAGFLDDSAEKQRASREILGSIELIRQVIQEQHIDDVIIALPLAAHERLTEVVCDLHDLPVHIWVIPDFFALTLNRAAVDEFAGFPMLDLRAPALNEYQIMVKRAFDIIVAVLILPFALPVMAAIAVAIHLDSTGPILYRTRRAGQNGREFLMMKFRTMVDGADRMLFQVASTDKEGHLIYKNPNDPRITHIGRFLRRTSLDELPQLFNVLKGDMSLVGPRPEIPELVERYDLWQRKRFAVPQGMTGWWQVNGRSDRPMHLHTEDDLYYVQHYSIWLDLQILWKTVWVVLFKKGAF